MGARPAMVMRWYKHGNAAEYLRVKNPDADRGALILDVARGLNYLHTLRPAPIVHGDLKGNNILITDEGRAALSDFGLSQVIEELVGPTGYTPSNAEVGPIRWQSPEFLEDENSRPTLPSDIWSFGCTAYELLVDKIPYHHRTRDYMVMKDIQGGIKPPGPDEMLLSEVEGGIWNVLQQCWSFAPANRPTMAEVISQLEVGDDRD
ncbi:kinase-like domain-containing protein [Infundibulicybe gibba]|nr:kinase-like domain-containing protein [Infundibulicybe gibba]